MCAIKDLVAYVVFGNYLSEVPWDSVITSNLSCEENLKAFTNIINYGMNTFNALESR